MLVYKFSLNYIYSGFSLFGDFKLNLNLKVLSKHHRFTNGKYCNSTRLIINKVKSIFPLKRRMFILPTRSITDYALVRRTISGNENSLWQLDGENITTHPWFGASKYLKKNIQHCYSWIMLGSTSKQRDTKRKNLEEIYIVL